MAEPTVKTPTRTSTLRRLGSTFSFSKKRTPPRSPEAAPAAAVGAERTNGHWNAQYAWLEGEMTPSRKPPRNAARGSRQRKIRWGCAT